VRSKFYGSGVTEHLQEKLSIGDAALRLGVSAHTLRYYERVGLLEVPRLSSTQRRYGPQELEWLRFLLALRATGMPMQLIRRYVDLVHTGENTVTERKGLLLEHQRAVEAQIAALHESLGAIERKIRWYDHEEQVN